MRSSSCLMPKPPVQTSGTSLVKPAMTLIGNQTMANKLLPLLQVYKADRQQNVFLQVAPGKVISWSAFTCCCCCCCCCCCIHPLRVMTALND